MSHSTRRSMIYACLFTLVAIAGMMAYAVAYGIGVPSLTMGSGEAQSAAFNNTAIAPIDAGSTPNVTIHDPDTKIYISTSSDGKVHIADVFASRGWIFGGHEAVAVAHSGNDVTIERSHTGSHVGFSIGSMSAHLSVAVPAAARLTITDADGLEITGVQGAIAAHAGDGTVRVTGTNGPLDIKAGGGRIYLTSVHAPRIVAHSYYGRIVLNDVSTEQLDADTRDGRIIVDGLKMVGDAPRAVIATQSGSMTVAATFPANGTYTLRTADGSVRLRLPPTSDLTVTAATSDGSVTADSAYSTTGEGGHRTAKLGNGKAAVSVTTADGSIHLETTGAL